ncbi:upf0317 protein c14orf159 mitochondrial isoform x6 [Nannochloropsis oceanica]
MSSTAAVIATLEAAVQRDEGKRGLTDLVLPAGELETAASALYHAPGPIAILTGFPCMLDHIPPTETDGPPGALAIIQACLALNKPCILLVEESNAAVLSAGVAAVEDMSVNLRVEVFPPKTKWGPTEDARLCQLAQEITFVVAIERTGPGASDGHYYTMRGKQMDEVVAPLERLLDLVPESVHSIGIGDGGNEVGMGKVLDRILASTIISKARQIACCTSTSWLLAASVSNWGGYALCCALAAVAAEVEATYTTAKRGKDGDKIKTDCMSNAKGMRNPANDGMGRRRGKWVERLVVSEAQDQRVLEAIVAAGARDGITGERKEWVDGMPKETSSAMLRELREIARSN